MVVVCPHCGHRMTVKGAKPGRYSPRCAACGKTFVLTVAADGEMTASIPPDAGAILAGGAGQTKAAPSQAPTEDPNATQPALAGGSPPSKGGAADPEATGVSTANGDSAMPEAAPGADATQISPASASSMTPAANQATQSPDVTQPSRPAAADVTAPSGFDARQAPGAASPDVTAPSQAAAPAQSAATAATIPSQVAGGADVTAPSRPAGGATVGAPSPPPSAPAQARREALPADVPRALGGYEILRELGRGGMGSVFLARQTSLDRLCAVKTMNSQWARNAEFVSRFTREAYAAAQLVHHNVVQIYEIGVDRGVNYFSMEYVEGASLGGMLKQHGKLDPREAVGYMLQAARGLRFAHEQGMIHRDVKPDNLMLNTHGVVKVADLGLVKTPASEDALRRRRERFGEIDDAPASPASAASTGHGDPTRHDPANAPDSAALFGGNPTTSEPGSIAEQASAEITLAGAAMGTPAYMAPEQGQDAHNVDGRADIYSLGCSLYVLLIGKPVFEGKTAMEVITKHATYPVAPPHVVDPTVPRTLSEIITRMVAKKPEERYPDMASVVQAFEAYLEEGGDRFRLSESDADAVQAAAQAYRQVPAGRTHRLGVMAFVALIAVAVLFGGLAGRFGLAGGGLALGLMTPLFYFVIHGLRTRSRLFARAREWALSSPPGDWAMSAVGLLVFIVLLWVFGQLAVWGGALVVALTLAAGFHLVVDRRLQSQREAVVEPIEAILRTARLQGMDEDALRQFICEQAGRHWEALYEHLFGLEAKLEARSRWGRDSRGQTRPKAGAWREPLLRWIDSRQSARRAAQERRHLARVEREALKAQGLSDKDAQDKAQANAGAMVDQAAEMRQAAQLAVMQTLIAAGALQTGGAGGTGGEGGAPPAQPLIRPAARGITDVDSDEEAARRREQARAKISDRPGLLGALFGARVRFIVGALLVAACVLWMHQNDLIPRAEQVQDISRTFETGDPAAITNLTATDADAWVPLDIPGAPMVIRRFFNSFNPGVAGLILLISALFRGARMTLFAMPAAAVILVGHAFGLPPIGPIPAEFTSLTAGLALFVVGLLLGRSRRASLRNFG